MEKIYFEIIEVVEFLPRIIVLDILTLIIMAGSVCTGKEIGEVPLLKIIPVLVTRFLLAGVFFYFSYRLIISL